MSDYSEMTYRELQVAAKEAGVDAKGTKEELLARLEKGSVVATEEDAAPQSPRESDADVAKALRTDQQKMKAHLDAQPKVRIMVPFDAGTNPETAKKIPFVVNLNGYRYEIPRGVFVEVPQQIGDVVMERLESEGKIGQEFRIDRDEAKMEALA